MIHLDENILLDYLEGELPDDQRTAVDAMLREQPDLRLLIEAMADDRQLMRKTPRSQPPADLMDRVTPRFERQMLLDSSSPDLDQQVVARRFRIGRVAAYSGIAAMFIFSAVLIYQTIIPGSGIFGGGNQTPGEDLAINHPSKSAESNNVAADKARSTNDAVAARGSLEKEGVTGPGMTSDGVALGNTDERPAGNEALAAATPAGSNFFETAAFNDEAASGPYAKLWQQNNDGQWEELKLASAGRSNALSDNQGVLAGAEGLSLSSRHSAASLAEFGRDTEADADVAVRETHDRSLDRGRRAGGYGVYPTNGAIDEVETLTDNRVLVSHAAAAPQVEVATNDATRTAAVIDAWCLDNGGAVVARNVIDLSGANRFARNASREDVSPEPSVEAGEATVDAADQPGRGVHGAPPVRERAEVLSEENKKPAIAKVEERVLADDADRSEEPMEESLVEAAPAAPRITAGDEPDGATEEIVIVLRGEQVPGFIEHLNRDTPRISQRAMLTANNEQSQTRVNRGYARNIGGSYDYQQSLEPGTRSGERSKGQGSSPNENLEREMKEESVPLDEAGGKDDARRQQPKGAYKDAAEDPRTELAVEKPESPATVESPEKLDENVVDHRPEGAGIAENKEKRRAESTPPVRVNYFDLVESQMVHQPAVPLYESDEQVTLAVLIRVHSVGADNASIKVDSESETSDKAGAAARTAEDAAEASEASRQEPADKDTAEANEVEEANDDSP